MTEVTLTLSAQTYNTIVQGLQEMPWKVANPAFQEIDSQVRAALARERKVESAPPVEEPK